MENIIREADLLKNDLKFIRTTAIIFKSYILIDDLSEFFNLCKQQNKAIFYMYKYYNKEDYQISDDLLDYYTDIEAEREFCMELVNEHNSKIEKLDFTNPYSLTLCSSFDQCIIIYCINNEWMKEMEIEKGKEVLLDFLETNEDEIAALYEDNEFIPLSEELADVLLADKEFRYLTIKDNRHMYIERFLEKKKNEKFLKLIKGIKDKWERRAKMYALVDQIYQEYKNKCRKLKIGLGEELPKVEEE